MKERLPCCKAVCSPSTPNIDTNREAATIAYRGYNERVAQGFLDALQKQKAIKLILNQTRVITLLETSVEAFGGVCNIQR